MSQTGGVFPALYDNQRRKPKPKVTPLPLHKVLAPQPKARPQKKGR